MKPKDIVKFAKTAGKLKRTPRTGWGMCGVKRPESVAEHSFRTALLVMLLSDLKGKRADKLIRMAILHDLEEAVTGDIITSEKDKNWKAAMKRGRNGLTKALATLPKPLRNKYLKLWEETEQKKTADSKFLKQVDYIEQMIQALEYEIEQGVNLQEFWDWTEGKLKDPVITEIFETLKKQRPKSKAFK